MNEAYSMFAKEGSLVVVPYVEPSFWEVLMSSPWFPKSHGIWTNNMQIAMCYMQYVMCCVQDVMCFVQDVMCCVQYDKYDDACYSHGITFLIQIWNVLSHS